MTIEEIWEELAKCTERFTSHAREKYIRAMQHDSSADPNILTRWLDLLEAARRENSKYQEYLDTQTQKTWDVYSAAADQLHISLEGLEKELEIRTKYNDRGVDAVEPLTMLRNLLASIHRDGGHHTEKVGLAQSFKDADERVATLNAESDERRGE